MHVVSRTCASDMIEWVIRHEHSLFFSSHADAAHLSPSHLMLAHAMLIEATRMVEIVRQPSDSPIPTRLYEDRRRHRSATGEQSSRAALTRLTWDGVQQQD